MSEWIKISEVKPPKKRDILLTDGTSSCIASVMYSGAELLIQFGYKRNMSKPTYWMNIPELPYDSAEDA